MRKRYDIENFLDDLAALLDADFNTYVAAMNAEKADGNDLVPLDAGARYLQSIGQTTVLADPFMVYGILNVKPIPVAPEDSTYVMKEWVIYVCLVLRDGDTDLNVIRRCLRYQRVLCELFQDNSRDGIGGFPYTMEDLMPVPYELLTDTGQLNTRIVGVTLTVRLE